MVDLNTGTHNELRKQLEREQDARLNATETYDEKKLNHPSAEETARQIEAGGFKIKDIQTAFRKEEDLRLTLERERDDNLHAYLEEREEKVKLIKRMNGLEKKQQERDRAEADKVKLERENRDEQYTLSEQEKQLNAQSRQSFKELMESRLRYRANK